MKKFTSPIDQLIDNLKQAKDYNIVIELVANFLLTKISYVTLAMLIIDLPENYSVLTLISNNINDKATFENIAIRTDFMNIAQESALWPTRIPVDYRLKGVLLESSESKDYDAGFSFKVKVEMVMCDMYKHNDIISFIYYIP